MARYTFFNGQVFISEGTYLNTSPSSERAAISSVLLFVKPKTEPKPALNNSQKFNTTTAISNIARNP